MYKVRSTANFSSETMETRRQCYKILKVLKEEKIVNQEFYIWPKLSFKNEVKIKIFTDKQKLKESIDNTSALQEILKSVLQAEMKAH